MPDIGFDIGLPPNETHDYFRAKGGRTITRNWWELWQEEHVRAFTVSKVTDLGVLNQIYRSLEKITGPGGGTFEMWKTSVLPDLVAAVQNGTAPPEILTDARLRTIYDTNLRMARAAGQWERIQASKGVTPYLMYFAVHDNRTRPEHRLWGGLDHGRKPITLPVDHPLWLVLYPPNGWGCRCNVIQLSERDLADNGWTVTTTAELQAMGLANDQGDFMPEVAAFLRGDGVVEQVPIGVDPGFAYNPGIEHLRGLTEAFRMALDEMAHNNLEVARAVLRETVETTNFDVLIARPNRGFPVAILDEKQRDLIGSKSAVVLLSSDTYAKQLIAHPELGIAEYRRLIDLTEAPQLILQQADQKLIFIRTADGKWLKATIKATRDRAENYVVSYQYADERELKRLRRRDTVIYDAEG